MNKKNVIEDLKEIRSIMDRSTRFISLSGLSGVLAGVYALLGSVAGYFILSSDRLDYDSPLTGYLWELPMQVNPILQLLGVAGVVLLAAVITAYVLTKYKAARHNQYIWNKQSLRLLINFLIPLGIGGLFTLVLLQYSYIGLVAPAMLIFYGLACIHASKYTLGTVKYLGLSCALLGLINTQFIGLGLYFWAAGFGVCHILYGAIMYYKFDR